MALAGTQNLKRSEPLTLQRLEEMELKTPAQLRALNPNDLVTSRLLEQFVSARPELRKELIASGVIGPNVPMFGSDRNGADDLRRVAAIWDAQDKQTVARDNAYAARAGSASSFSDAISNFAQSVSSSVSNAWDATKDFAVSAWQNMAAAGKNMWQTGTNFVTKTMPNFFTKTIPDALRSGINIISRGINTIVSNAKNLIAPVVQVVKSLGHSIAKTAVAAVTSVLNTVKTVSANIMYAVTSPVETAKSMLRSGREWVARLGGAKTPAVAAATLASVVVATTGVQPPIAKAEASNTKPTPLAALQPSNPRRGNLNALRTSNAQTPAQEQKPPSQSQQSSQSPAGRNPNRVSLRMAGGPLSDVTPKAAPVVANATPPAQTAAPVKRARLFISPGLK